MELRNCPNCGKVFAFVANELCPSCADEDEKEFAFVRAYLECNPNVTLEQVHQATAVPKQRILKFLREGRLVNGVARGVALECERCGRPLSGGRLCASCIREVTDELDRAKRGRRLEAEPATGRMYTADRVIERRR